MHGELLGPLSAGDVGNVGQFEGVCLKYPAFTAMPPQSARWRWQTAWTAWERLLRLAAGRVLARAFRAPSACPVWRPAR